MVFGANVKRKNKKPRLVWRGRKTTNYNPMNIVVALRLRRLSVRHRKDTTNKRQNGLACCMYAGINKYFAYRKFKSRSGERSFMLLMVSGLTVTLFKVVMFLPVKMPKPSERLVYKETSSAPVMPAFAAAVSK